MVLTEGLVTIKLGTDRIALPEPLALPWRQLASETGHGLSPAQADNSWVFRGSSPGRHIHPGHLCDRFRSLFSTRAARLGTLRELTKLAPATVIAEMLGYSPVTIERHAIDSASTYAQYVAAVHKQYRSPALQTQPTKSGPPGRSST